MQVAFSRLPSNCWIWGTVRAGAGSRGQGLFSSFSNNRPRIRIQPERRRRAVSSPKALWVALHRRMFRRMIFARFVGNGGFCSV
jgi:hypothetical protein